MTSNDNKNILIKGKNDLPVAVTVNKGQIVNRNYKRVVNLSKNETVYSQGDGIIKIAPFDNYYLFTIYSEINLEDVPVDLNNMGDFYLVFKDKKSEVRIKNFTNTKDINVSSGQILFKISQEDAEKILSLTTDIFYVTSAVITNDSKSDETVIYSGKFAEYNKANNDSLSNTIKELKNEIEELNSNFTIEKAQMQATIDELNDLVTKLQNDNSNISEQLSSYKKMCDILSTKVTTDILSQAQQQSQQTQSTNVNNEPKNKYPNISKTIVDISAFDGLEDPSPIPLAPNNTGSGSSNNSNNNESDEPSTESEAKTVLGNLVPKNGKLQIIGYVTTAKNNSTGGIADDYIRYKYLITYIRNIISKNKNNNIVCMFMDTELDKPGFKTLYNITTNSIVVAKSPDDIWGNINLTKKLKDSGIVIPVKENESKMYAKAKPILFEIEKDIINIIKSNNN